VKEEGGGFPAKERQTVFAGGLRLGKAHERKKDGDGETIPWGKMLEVNNGCGRGAERGTTIFGRGEKGKISRKPNDEGPYLAKGRSSIEGGRKKDKLLLGGKKKRFCGGVYTSAKEVPVQKRKILRGLCTAVLTSEQRLKA